MYGGLFKNEKKLFSMLFHRLIILVLLPLQPLFELRADAACFGE